MQMITTTKKYFKIACGSGVKDSTLLIHKQPLHTLKAKSTALIVCSIANKMATIDAIVKNVDFLSGIVSLPNDSVVKSNLVAFLVVGLHIFVCSIALEGRI